jgi:DNA-directed RNA polymerase specialized sigma24 family protein
MAGRLIRSSAVCRHDWSARRIVPGAQKCFRTRSKSGVLSGFPTALEPTLPPSLPGTSVSSRPSGRRPSQLPLPRDDIPATASCCRRARSLPPPPGPDLWFLLPFVFTQGCSMGRPERILSWWDQEVDRTGRPIRDDVRSAAHEVWREACRRTQSLLADPAQAADVMEDSVVQVSRYLDRVGAPSSSSKNGLLLLAFSRALRRLAAKSSRLEPAGGAVELSRRVVDHGWSRQVDARLDLENMVRKLSERNSVVLALRAAGYNWKEVAQALGTSVATVRSGFWREIREVRRKLQIDEKQRDRIDHRLSREHSKPAPSDGVEG